VIRVSPLVFPAILGLRGIHAEMRDYNRRVVIRSFGLTLTATLLGCSGEESKVAEGDSLARRKKKDEALEKMLNPQGVSTKPKGKRSAANKAIDEMHLP